MLQNPVGTVAEAVATTAATVAETVVVVEMVAVALDSPWQVSVDVEPDVWTSEDHCIVADVGLHRVLHQEAPHGRQRAVGSKHVPARGKNGRNHN